jgi:hypothetical protein
MINVYGQMTEAKTARVYVRYITLPAFHGPRPCVY